MLFLKSARPLIILVALSIGLAMTSSCSQTTEVRSDVDPAAVARLSPDQLVWHYVSQGDSKSLDEHLKSYPNLVNIYEDSYYNTPLHSAALRGDWDTAKVLLENGADPFIENVNGEIPAESALQEAHVDLSKYLREFAANSN